MRLKHDSEMMMIELMTTMLMAMKEKQRREWSKGTDSVAAGFVEKEVEEEVEYESVNCYRGENTAEQNHSYCFPENVDGSEVGGVIDVDHKHRHLILSGIVVDRYLPFDE